MDTWGKSPIEFEFSQDIPSFQSTVFDNGACSTTTWNSHPEASSSKEGMFPACDSVTRKSSHQRKKPDNHIPRPPNAFILFRASFIKSQHVSSSVETNHSTLSKIIGLTWTHLPEPERQLWHAKARAALDDHKKRFPSYAFKPAAKGSKANSTGAVDSDCTVPSTPAKRRRLVVAPSSPESTLFATPETPATFQRATMKRIPRASLSTSAPKPRKRTASNRAPVPKDVARCEKIAQLLVAGTRGTALDDAVAEFDKTHVPVYETTFLEVHMPSDFEKHQVVEEVKVEEEAGGGVQFFQESGLTYNHSSKADSPRVKKLRSSSAPRGSSSKLRLKPSRHSSPATASSPTPCFEQSPYSPTYDEDVFFSPQPTEVYSAYNAQQQAQCYSTYQQHVYDDTTNQYPNQSATAESFDFSAFDFRNTTTPAPPSFSPTEYTAAIDVNAAFEALPSFANFVETTSGYEEPRRLSINTDFSQWTQSTTSNNEYNFDRSSSPPSSSPAFDYTSSPSSFGSSPHSSMPATPLMGPFDFGVAPRVVAPSSLDPWADSTFSSLSEYQSPSEYVYIPETTGYAGGAEGLTPSYGYDFGASESQQRKDAEFALFMGSASSEPSFSS